MRSSAKSLSWICVSVFFVLFAIQVSCQRQAKEIPVTSYSDEAKELFIEARDKYEFAHREKADALLIEAIAEMGNMVVISPKEQPILNEATVDDMEEMGLGQYGAIIPHTCDTIGLTMETMAEGFIEVWDNADLIIAKGIGYYETLFGVRENIAFLLKAVCEPIARSLNVKQGDNVILF